jgi:hypothetical protein
VNGFPSSTGVLRKLDQPEPRSRARWTRVAGFVLGLLFLAAAGCVLFRQRDELSTAWSAARAAPWSLILAVALLPLGNWGLTSAIFWVLTRRYARVGGWEMAALLGSAWLLNMLPFKPGLVGRVAYHRQISRIPVVTSVLVTITAMLTGVFGIAVALAAQLAIDRSLRAQAPPAMFVVMIGVVLGLAAGLAAILAWRTRVAGLPMFSGPWAVSAAVLLRVADTHVWSLRYALAFRLIGHEQAYGVCVVVASVSQIAAQLPVQFGLREWAVGGSSGLLGSRSSTLTSASAAPGLTVDLLSRAAEICCALPVGLVSSLWIWRRLRRLRAERQFSAGSAGNSNPGSGV